MPGSLILYLKGMRTTMFQLSGFYCWFCNRLASPSATGFSVQGILDCVGGSGPLRFYVGASRVSIWFHKGSLKRSARVTAKA